VESRSTIQLGRMMLAAGRTERARAAFERCVALGDAADPGCLAEAHERLAELDAAPADAAG
jgi:hypothetical protein